MPGRRLLAPSPRARLVLLTFLMLFLELALIRWLGANVLYLAYFSNVVLLGSFLGIGLGFLRAGRSETSLLPWTPLALAVCVVAAKLLDAKVGIAGGNLIFFGLDTSGPSRAVVLPVVFAAVAAVMTCVGDGVARAFREHANLDAYGLDIVGSIAGSVAFGVLAFLHAPPLAWGLLIGAVLLITVRPRTLAMGALVVVPLVAVLGVWGADSLEEDTEWTPYYRTRAIHFQRPESDAIIAEVNGVPDLAPAHRRRQPDLPDRLRANHPNRAR